MADGAAVEALLSLARETIVDLIQVNATRPAGPDHDFEIEYEDGVRTTIKSPVLAHAARVKEATLRCGKRAGVLVDACKAAAIECPSAAKECVALRRAIASACLRTLSLDDVAEIDEATADLEAAWLARNTNRRSGGRQSQADIDIKIREYLKKHTSEDRMPTLRVISGAVGCSTGAVSRSAAYQAVKQCRQGKRRSVNARTNADCMGVIDSSGSASASSQRMRQRESDDDRDAMIDRLTAEQAADDASDRADFSVRS